MPALACPECGEVSGGSRHDRAPGPRATPPTGQAQRRETPVMSATRTVDRLDLANAAAARRGRPADRLRALQPQLRAARRRSRRPHPRDPRRRIEPDHAGLHLQQGHGHPLLREPRTAGRASAAPARRRQLRGDLVGHGDRRDRRQARRRSASGIRRARSASSASAARATTWTRHTGSAGSAPSAPSAGSTPSRKRRRSTTSWTSGCSARRRRRSSMRT